LWQTNGGPKKLFELESLWRFELISTLSEKRRRRYSETYTTVSRDKRVNEFGCGCGHASTMCRPVLACVCKNFFTSPLCTTVCVCEKTLRLFEQTIHFDWTGVPHLCPLCMSVYAHKLQTRADGECRMRPSPHYRGIGMCRYRDEFGAHREPFLWLARSVKLRAQPREARRKAKHLSW
jgi:hypothetical protein